MILYDHWRSLPAMRVRIALALKGLAYEQRGGSLDGMPNIARVVAACEADPRFTAAHPLRQPGAPGR